ncbi:MAG: hypothetical protein PW735_03495 [Acidobacteriaceae bacterium]|nr:hypothetical protein [Acidobacteriaceae bacterium]
MRTFLLSAALLITTAVSAVAQQQPPGVSEILSGLSSQPSTHTAFTLDRDMLDTFLGEGTLPPAALTGITFERYTFHQSAFYIPENLQALVEAYHAAGWSHLVDQGVSPGQNAQPDKPITDLWMHHDGANIDHVTVLIRARSQMNLIEVSGMLRPLDLVHLSGHFGIPKVDQNAVMVPAPK